MKTELLELAIKHRSAYRGACLADLPTHMQHEMVGAAIADEPERIAEFLEDVNPATRITIGKLIQSGDLCMAMVVLVDQFKDAPYFRDILSDVQAKADEAIEDRRRSRFEPCDIAAYKSKIKAA
jgi:hypothetical protein